MRSQLLTTSSYRDKGKARELDPVNVLAQLNRLLELLLIPISLPEISVATPSLLLAVLESILERRFLALDDSTRTSRSPHSRSKCLKIIVKVLARTLNPDLDRWSPDSINLNQLVQGESLETLKLIDGLVKLSKQSNNSISYDPSGTRKRPPRETNAPRQPDQPIPRSKANSAQASKDHHPKHPDLRSERVPPKNSVLSRRSTSSASVTSSSSSLSIEPSKIPFDRIFSYPGLSFEDSSQKPPTRAFSTASSNGGLRRSFNRLQDNENPPAGSLSNPPTLRNLLGPLHAHMANSKRPQTPRTAHRTMVNRLRNEGNYEDLKEQILSHDTDTSMPPRIGGAEENYDHSFEESRYPHLKSFGMMTLDGIEPDDPFVSMETRRALESQFMQNQSTASFDHTQLAVAGRERSSSTFHSSKSNQSHASIPEHQHDTRSIFSSSTTSSRLSYFERDIPLYDETPDQASHHHVHRYDAVPSLRDLGSSRESAFGEEEIDQRNEHSNPSESPEEHYGDAASLHPCCVPLPGSPIQSSMESSNCRILLASEGAKLDLVITDVRTFEERKQQKRKIEGWDWMDVETLSRESERLRRPGSTAKIGQKPHSHLDLVSRKLELLQLLNLAHTHAPMRQDSNSQSSESKIEPTHDLSKAQENTRVRVHRQSIQYPNPTCEDFNDHHTSTQRVDHRFGRFMISDQSHAGLNLSSMGHISRQKHNSNLSFDGNLDSHGTHDRYLDDSVWLDDVL